MKAPGFTPCAYQVRNWFCFKPLLFTNATCTATPRHKSEADRAAIARRTREMLEEFYRRGEVPTWMDTMDGNLEELYEARPWWGPVPVKSSI